MVMGTVAFIEERGELNLGLGIPAGAATVLATGKISFFFKSKILANKIATLYP